MNDGLAEAGRRLAADQETRVRPPRPSPHPHDLPDYLPCAHRADGWCWPCASFLENGPLRPWREADLIAANTRAALNYCGGDELRAAEALGVDVRTVRNRLRGRTRIDLRLRGVGA